MMKKFILSTAMLAGVFAMAQNTGIGTTNPTEKLEVAGNIKSTTINANTGAATDKVVVADTDGVLKSVARAGVDTNAWQLTGNAITAGQFLGTTNDQDLVFKRNGNSAYQITKNYRLVGGHFMNVFIGSTGNDTYTTAQNNIGIGANGVLANITTGIGNIAFGERILQSLTSGQENYVMGRMSAGNITTGNYNMLFGLQTAMALTTGSSNIAIGHSALQSITNEINNTAIGGSAMKNQTGSYNVSVGAASLSAAVSTGNYNTVVGYNALSVIGVNGNNNTAIGYNTVLPNTSGSNQMSLGNSIFGLNINDGTIVATSFPSSANLSNDLIGIATPTPKETLDVAGNIRVRSNGSTTGAVGTSVTVGASCTNLGTISFGTDGNFYGCTGTASPGVWKQLNN